MLFYLDLTGKTFCQKILRSKIFKQTLRHEAVEAEEMESEAEPLRVEAGAIQKLPLPHPCVQ